MKTILLKRLLFLIVISFYFGGLCAQDLQTQLKEKAVKIEYLDSLERTIYDKLKGFKLIMIGEMHGTNEPVKFLVGLSELFINQGDTVQVGLEIPSDQMTNYINNHSESSVFQSDFFAKDSNDGRASLDWANAISRLSKKSKVQIFFFDNDKAEYQDKEDRDSLMYLKIKQKLIEHPNWRTITLSGNIHNMRLPYKEKPTTAFFLCNDNMLNLTNEICTLNHYYGSGTMLNNIGKGLALQQVNNTQSIYSNTLDFDNYLFLFQTPNKYNGIFFTKTVSASKLAIKR